MKILELFRQREESYKRFTQDLLHELKNVIDVIHQMLDDETTKYLTWKMVEKTGPEMEDIIVIIGMSTFPIGYNLQVDSGEFIEVTEDTQEFLQRVIRVGIPIKLAVEGTPDEIKNYFETTGDNIEPLIRESENVRHTSARDLVGDFAVRDLTDAEITQMLYNAEQTKGKIN